MSIEISVVISTYNQSDLIIKSVNILKEQSIDDNIITEVIVTDDGSSPYETERIIFNLSKGNNVSSFSFKYVWQEDLGFRLAQAWNNGIALSQGQIIIITTGDCIPEKGFLKNHAEAHRNHKGKLICIGHRRFKHPTITANTAISEDSKKILAHLKLMEDMEEYTIESKYQTSTPWRAVLGRNFSFRRPETPIYFDNRLYGWGADDFGFAIELQEKGYKDLIYEKQAIVTQYDDLSESNNPLDNCNQQKIAYVQANYLLQMKKFEYNAETYIELANFLAYYVVPFDFDGQEFQLNEERKQKFLADFSIGLSTNQQEAKILYKTVLENLKSFFEKNSHIKRHPAMLYVESCERI